MKNNHLKSLPPNSDTVMVACGAMLQEYSVETTKLKRQFRIHENGGTVLKVVVNQHRTLVAVSSADKNIYVVNFMTSKLVIVIILELYFA